MKDRINAWAERFEAFSLRERAMMSLAVIALMFMLWDASLMSPEEVKQKQIVAKMHDTNQQSEMLNLQIREMSAALEGGQARHINSRVTELRKLLAELKQKQKELTVEFIQPAQMAGVLRDMLAADSDLVLTRLESLGAEPLFPPSENEAGEVEGLHQPGIFKHGMRIVFEGDYFSTLKYLQALEAMPWRLYWDNVEYHVLEYPRARVAITVHTLSLHEGWIGV